MKYRAYGTISDRTDALIDLFKEHPRANSVTWVVQELMDGYPVALYADHLFNSFQVSNGSKFLSVQDKDYGWGAVARLFRKVALDYSHEVKMPVIIYGTLLGGSYPNVRNFGPKIPSVCEYAPHQEFVVHDIRFAAGYGHFINMFQLQNFSSKYAIKLAPILYSGNFGAAIKYPDNKLSALPFMHKLAVLKDNQMKGIVIRPAVELEDSTQYRMIMKSVNPKYAKVSVCADRIREIAASMFEVSYTDETIESAFIESGSWSLADADRVAGLLVKKMLDTATHVQYSYLINGDQNLVNKELNRLVKEAVVKMLQTEAA